MASDFKVFHTSHPAVNRFQCMLKVISRGGNRTVSSEKSRDAILRLTSWTHCWPWLHLKTPVHENQKQDRRQRAALACQPTSWHPYNVKSLQHLRRNLIHPWHLTTGKLHGYLCDLFQGHERVFTQVFRLCLFTRRHVSRLQNLKSAPSACFPQLLPKFSVCFCDGPGRSPLGQMISVSCFHKQPSPKGAPSLALTAPFTSSVNKWVLRLLPRQAPVTFRPPLVTVASTMNALNMFHSYSISSTFSRMHKKLLWRWRLKSRRIGSSTHYLFGFSGSFQQPATPPDPNHHQVLISWHRRPSFHPNVQNIQPQIRWSDNNKVDHQPSGFGDPVVSTLMSHIILKQGVWKAG